MFEFCSGLEEFGPVLGTLPDTSKAFCWIFDVAGIEMGSLMMGRLKERPRYWGF